MTYIENIFLCMVSPLLVAALCMGRRHLRFFLFCIVGMGVCLLSAYINTFLASVCQADALAATEMCIRDSWCSIFWCLSRRGIKSRLPQ